MSEGLPTKKIQQEETVPEWTLESGMPPPLTAEYGYVPPVEEISKYDKTSLMKERGTVDRSIETDTQGRSIESVIRRNNAFIVAVITEAVEVRHNENSNVAPEVTYEDDVDIMLAFEPSVSASSVQPGIKSRLWPGASGFIFGGGTIGEVGASDIGTHAEGLKKRGGNESELEQVDAVIGRNRDIDRKIFAQHGEFGMNEIVVNNPEVYGFFQIATRDDQGVYWIGSGDTIKRQAEAASKEGSQALSRDSYTSLLRRNVERYRHRFSVAQERGLPVFILTSEREVWECLALHANGTVEVGKQLTPEEVISGRAGLPTEERKKIGSALLKKKLFRDEVHQREAQEIIESLGT